MIKVVYLFKRHSDLSAVQFSDYWRNTHGPIGARIPGLRKLVQSVAIEMGGSAGSPDFDGMAELWFDDWRSLLNARQSREWKASTEDESNFIDAACTAYFVTEERRVL